MDIVFRNFFRSFYMRTGGFVPTRLPGQTVFPGDFFQVHNGEIIVLGNVFREGIIDRANVKFEYELKLNPAGWNFSDGVTKPYSGRGSGHGPIDGDFEFSKQVLAFGKKGDFIFKTNGPESVKITNWSELQQQLIIKMTQTHYSFRELYIVTESAAASDWTLAIAGSAKAELEICADTENSGLVDIFGYHSAKTIQSKDIAFYHREQKKRPSFFKAKKLMIQEEKTEVLVSSLIAKNESKNDWAGNFFDYDFCYDAPQELQISASSQINAIDLLRANELNPNTALLYFKWVDMNLDDIEKFFPVYQE